MSKLNPVIKNTGAKKFSKNRTAGGSGILAAAQTPEQLLRREVLACLLFENVYYKTMHSAISRIRDLIPQVDADTVANIAREARLVQKLRHTPLFIACEMAKHPEHAKHLSVLLPEIITRADMITDFLALYWKDKKQKLSNQVKKGLASSFHNFNAYQFAKYDRDSVIKLRDVMFLVHPKPQDQVEEMLFKQIAERNLPIPDTWETELSKSKDKKASWTRLVKENRLPALAFLRNLRNMKQEGVDHNVIRAGFKQIHSQMLLPINFLAAYRHAPEFKAEIEELMERTYAALPKMPGHSIHVVDVSGSMGGHVSGRSEFSRIDVAAAMALLALHSSESCDIYCTAGSDGMSKHKTVKLEYPSKGFDLLAQINEMFRTLGGGGIFTRQCLDYIKQDYKGPQPDRIAVFSDSQDMDHSENRVPKPFAKNNYIVDVSSESYGVNYKGVWTAEISGWSEHFLTYIACIEGQGNQFEDAEVAADAEANA